MHILAANADQTVELGHEGHRFHAALDTWFYARAIDGTPDRTMLASGPLLCADGDGYTCSACFPLLGECDAQRLLARAAAAFGEYQTVADAAQAVRRAILAAGGVVRFDPNRP